MLLLQTDILEMVAMGEPLADTTRALCLRVEAMLPQVVCSIVGAGSDGRLRALAGPSLTQAYTDAIDGLAIGPQVGSCGAAIATGRPVEVIDITVDPRWRDYAPLALEMGLRACWSTPIFGRDGAVLGAFAFYYREPRGHTEREAEIVQASIHLCAIALERDQQAAAQHRLAYRDLLTGLPNRAAFNQASDRLFSRGGEPPALLIIDLDNLKTVNDTFGHRAGDSLLRAAAGTIEGSAAPHKAFRLGGDEFAILVGGGASPEAVTALAQRVLDSLSSPVDCDGHLTMPCATIGGANAAPGETADDLRQHADFALYHAKETRRGGFVAYSTGLGTTMTRRLRAIREVDLALQDGRIDAWYQPIVRIDTGEIVGLEALFRVITPDGRVMTAGDYFEATTDAHIATRLTHRMLNIVARDVRAWLDQGIWFQHVGVNAASSDFHDGRLLEVIKTAFDQEDVPLSHVILEITESVYMGHAGDSVVRQIQALRANGLRVALDDFGTGFASLTHLLSAPVDIIKIDKSFVARMEPEGRAAAIVEGLLGIASKLGLKVVAEGVETEGQAAQLRAFGCSLGQGFLYSKAVDRREITRLLFDKAQKQDPDLTGPEADGVVTPPDGALDAAPKVATGHVMRYAVLLCGDDWRVVSERRQFGRFASRSAAFQCALRLAREANASGASVELLHADGVGELRRFYLQSDLSDAEEAPPQRRAAAG